MSDVKDTRSRKWQLTLNNPLDKGLTHDKIKDELLNLKSLVYFCMADEIGESKTPHTHIYAVFKNQVRFSTLKKIFLEGHMEMARGTSQQNKDYIAKEGKWANDAKHGTKVDGTFEEYGEMPIEQQGRKADMGELNELILLGASNVEIFTANPRYMIHFNTIERVRQEYKADKCRREFRKLDVTYIFGKTGTGKTRSVMDSHGYENVYRVSEYDYPFEGYQGEDVIIFDEFHGQFKITKMLNYLDGYPLALPSRYNNKQACYTKVYIISNLRPEDQYHNVKIDSYDTWQAFFRRIHKVVHVNEVEAMQYSMKDYTWKFVASFEQTSFNDSK